MAFSFQLNKVLYLYINNIVAMNNQKIRVNILLDERGFVATVPLFVSKFVSKLL